MTINDITILKSTEPITILDKPNPKTIEFLAKLAQDQKFLQFVEMIRSQNNFPKEGIEIKQFIGNNFSELPAIKNSLIKDTLEYAGHKLSESMGISDEFNINFIMLIFFNAFIDIDYFEGFITKPIQFVPGRRNISDSMFSFDHEVGAIIIPYNMSQNTLVKWIKENWKNIQKQMDKNITLDPYMLRLHKNTEIATEIVSLKDKKHKTFKEIADELSKNYPENEFVTDGEWVKKVYYDYKEMWNKS